MADIAFLAIIVAFFIVCVGYVHLCGWIIGPDDSAELETGTDEPVDDALLERAA